MCACFDLGYVLSNIPDDERTARSAYIYVCLAWFDVLLIPRIIQVWNSQLIAPVVCISRLKINKLTLVGAQLLVRTTSSWWPHTTT